VRSHISTAIALDELSAHALQRRSWSSSAAAGSRASSLPRNAAWCASVSDPRCRRNRAACAARCGDDQDPVTGCVAMVLATRILLPTALDVAGSGRVGDRTELPGRSRPRCAPLAGRLQHTRKRHHRPATALESEVTDGRPMRNCWRMRHGLIGERLAPAGERTFTREGGCRSIFGWPATSTRSSDRVSASPEIGRSGAAMPGAPDHNRPMAWRKPEAVSPCSTRRHVAWPEPRQQDGETHHSIDGSAYGIGHRGSPGA